MPDAVTPSGNAFGFMDDGDVADLLEDPAAGPQAPAPTAPDPAAGAQAPEPQLALGASADADPFGEDVDPFAPPAAPESQAPTAPDPSTSAQPPGSPGSPAEGQITFAGRPFKGIAEAEETYKQMQRLQFDSAERLKQAQAERDQAMAYLQWVAQQAQMQAQLQQPPPGQVDPALEAELHRMYPDEEQRELARGFLPLMQSRIAQAQQQMAQVYEQRLAQERQVMLESQRRAAFEGAVNAFMSAHPDVQPGSPEEYALAQTIQRLGIPITDPKTALERAYEISRHPGLEQVIAAVPVLAHSEQGMAQARSFANLPAPGQAQGPEQQRVRDAREAEAARRAAHVETGGQGAPTSLAPGARPPDEFDRALAAHRATPDNAFGFRS